MLSLMYSDNCLIVIYAIFYTFLKCFVAVKEKKMAEAASGNSGTGPVCLLSCNVEGKWEISEDAVKTLEQIKEPVASVAIVGESVFISMISCIIS